MTNVEAGADSRALDKAPEAPAAPTSPHGGVAVAPLPRADDFHVGHVIAGTGGVASPPKAAHESEESYIPVALARAHLARAVQDMHTMKQEQAAKMSQIVERYKTIEAETKAYYAAYITELKRKAKDKFRGEQMRFTALESEQRETQQLAGEEIRALVEKSDQQQRRHQQQKAAWREDAETAFVRYEEELTRLHARVTREMDAALERQAHSLTETHATELQHLQTSWDDARTASVRAVEQAKQELKQQLAQTEAACESRVRQMKWDADVALETFRCLAAVVNRVVDMDAQLSRRKRSRELRGELDALAQQAQAAAASERALATQLRTVTAQYDATEQRAVRQTMDVMLRTIELQPVKTQTRASRDPEPTPTPPVRPAGLCVEREAQTTDWAALLVARTPVVETPQVETRDAAVETTAETEETKAVPALVPALPTAAQLQYEADAERFRERNAELLQSKQTLQALKTELQASQDRKGEAKARIKQWLADFQRQHAREPTIEEKAQVKDLYLAFKQGEEAYNAAKARVADAKAQHHTLVVEIEALSQWQALTASARGSSRDAASSRPGTAASTSSSSSSGALTTEEPRVPPTAAETADANASISPSQPSAAATLAEVDKLAKEIDGLRAELKVAHAETQKARIDAQRGALDALKAQADAKETGDRLQAALLEAATPCAPVDAHAPSKAPSKAEGKENNALEEEQAKREADDIKRQHEERVVAFARESEALDRERAELQAATAALREELAARAKEKQALETQIDQLRLHAELMDERVDIDDDDAEELPLESDAKTGAHDEEDEEEEELEEEAAPPSALSPLKSPVSEAERAEGVREAQLVAQIRDAIEAGKAQWNRGDKAKCFQLYVKMSDKCVETLRAARSDEAAAFRAALQEAGRLPPAKGSMVLRRQLDACLAACEAIATQRAEAEAMAKTAATTPSSSPQRRSPHKKSVAPSAFPSEDALSSSAAAAASAASPSKTAASDETRQKLKALESKAKADKVRITQLEAALAKAETQLQNASASSSSGGGGGALTAVLERKLAEAEKKHARALDEAEKALKRELAALAQQLGASQTKSQALQAQADALSSELAVAGGRATQLAKLEGETVALRAKAAQADALDQALAASQRELAALEVSYKEEQALRKKYYNTIEDMKGKIRVFARCRPMSSSERERGCDASVKFVDEFSLELKTSHGPKTFAFDQVFTPASSQEQVFEDTKNLLQSALDGYNVCIFAYGQTGSGKTFTMTGSEGAPGLSPRAIHHLFRLAEESRANHTLTFQASMLELYNDALIDLLFLVDGGAHDAAPKLDIKKNDRGMVFVANATSKSCTSAQQTLKLFEAANRKRQVGATKMNAESSRSHSVFSLTIENYNKTTKATTVGKLSLVDLAGSERAGKTGATNERLKEAQAINKSLSALGDVIAALSAGDKFIPYRNNKLTQLMQDSLGGNAKTLMFVNISPADYNQEETQTSLQYASRVKLITNNANKTSESETVNKLKAIIKQLRAGKTDVELDGLGID